MRIHLWVQAATVVHAHDLEAPRQPISISVVDGFYWTVEQMHELKSSIFSEPHSVSKIDDAAFMVCRKKVVVHSGGTIKKGRLINVKRCRVAGSDVSVARAANLHQATQEGKVDQCHTMPCCW